MPLHHVTEFFSKLKSGNVFIHKGTRLVKSGAFSAIDERSNTVHIIAGDPKVKVFRFRKYKAKTSVKVKWSHDAWTLATLYERYKDSDEGPMLQALQYLRSGVSINQIMSILTKSVIVKYPRP